MTLAMLVFFGGLALAVARSCVSDDLLVTLQVDQKIAEPVKQIAKLAPSTLTNDTLCRDFILQDRMKKEIVLRPRTELARVIDTFLYGYAQEEEELLIRLYEMGDEVSEFHVFEGDHDFVGAKKIPPYTFEILLNSGKLDAWKDKIIYHKLQLEALDNWELQESHRRAMRKQMNSYNYELNDIRLEGDLDEVVSRKVLQALKSCEPETGAWNTKIRMANLYYNVGWTNGDGDWYLPTTAAFISEIKDIEDGRPEGRGQEALLESNFSSIWTKPNLLRARDGSLTGWHFSWMLNGPAGLAHKIFVRTPGFPDWAKPYSKDEATLAKFIEDSFYADPHKYDLTIRPSNLEKDDLPRALFEHPELFPSILHGMDL